MIRASSARLMRLYGRMGRRGEFLALLGACWVLYGVSMLIEPARLMPPNVFDFHLLLPPALRAIVWIVGGGVAFAYGVRRRGRDTHGFTGLLVPPLSWSVSYFLSWVTLHIPFIHMGDRRGWAVGLLFFVMAVMTYRVAGWPEPVEPRMVGEPHLGEDDEEGEGT